MLNKTHNIELIKKYPISVSFPKGLDAVSIVRPFNNAKSGLLIMEIWKDIKGYENYYQISNYGRVKSLTRLINHPVNGKKIVRERIRKPFCTIGYKIAILYKNGCGKNHSVHRLVGTYFIPNPENKPQINHIDHNRSNNNVVNLEWCTRSENMQSAIKFGAMKTKITEKNIKYIMKTQNTHSRKEIAKKFKISCSYLSNIIHGRKRVIPPVRLKNNK